MLLDSTERLQIDEEKLKEINEFFLEKENPLTINLLEIVDKYGGAEEINRKAREVGKLENLLTRLETKRSTLANDLDWLIKQRDKQAFISIPEYRERILGKKVAVNRFDESFAITLEISAFNFFPWLIEEAKKSLAGKELMPARYIRVRSMKEQVEDDDIIATQAAMQIIGASFVEP